jgi:hypothetical protein
MERIETPGFTGPDPLSPAARFTVRNGAVYVAETFTPAVRILSPEGTPQREISWVPTDTLVPDEALRAIIDSAASREALLIGSMRERLEAFPPRDRVPVFWDMLVDTRGFIWIQPFEPGRHSVVLGLVSGGPRADGAWWTLSPQGERLGSVNVPSGVQPSQVTDDALVGLFRDDLGVEFVHVHRVHRN